MSKDFYSSSEKVKNYIQAALGVNSEQLISKLRAYLPAETSLLELGSGPGTDWALLSKIYHVTGSDFSDAFLDHLKEANPHGTFLKIDASNIKTNQPFDGIFSNKVLHHLTDDQLNTSIQTQYVALQTEGIICHSFWQGEGTEDFNGMFVNYHTKSELHDKFSPQFEILLLETYQEFDPNDSLILIAKKRKG